MPTLVNFNQITIYHLGSLEASSVMELAIGNLTDNMSVIWATSNGLAFSYTSDGTSWVTPVKLPHPMVAKVVRYCLEANPDSRVWPTEIAAILNTSLLGSIPQGPAPEITSVSPIAGPPGTELVVAGANFRLGASVTLGDVPCGNISWRSDAELRCVTAPTGQAGPVELRVLNADGTEATLPHAFLPERFCPSSGFRAPVLTESIRGNSLVVVADRLSPALAVITANNPASAPPACRLPLEWMQASLGPDGDACAQQVTYSLPLEAIANCSEITVTEEGDDTSLVTIPLQFGSFLSSGTDPDDPTRHYQRTLYTSDLVTVRKTVRARASTAASGQHAAYLLQFEVGASYFSVADQQLSVQILAVINRVYTLVGAEITSPAGGPNVGVSIERHPAVDNCPDGDTTHRCERGYLARLGAVGGCPLPGNYSLRFDVRCVSSGSCPEGTEGLYEALLIVHSETCQASLLNLAVAASLEAVRPADGAPLGAFQWGQDVTLVTQLTPETLTHSEIADLRVCVSPAVAGPCPTGDSILLISAGEVTRQGRALNVRYTEGAARHTTTVLLDSAVFQSSLGVGGNVNVNTTLQFDVVADNFEFGASSASTATATAGANAAGANSAAFSSAVIGVSWPATPGSSSMMAIIGGASAGAVVLVAAVATVATVLWKRTHGRRPSARSKPAQREPGEELATWA